MNGIGLLGLLLGVAIIFVVMFYGFGGKSQVQTVADAKKYAETEINDLSGRDAQGRRATDSLTYEVDDKGVKIATVEAGGAFDTKYGLQPGDIIVELGPQSVKGLIGSSAEARDWLHDAYQRSFTIVIVRDGKRLKLPEERTPTATAATPAAPTNPTAAQPAAPQSPPKTPKGAALDLVNKIESH